MDEIIDDIKKLLKSENNSSEEKIKIAHSKTTNSISNNNFSELINNVKNSEKKIVFIDGGNAEIIGCSAFSIQLMRSRAVFYKGKKRTDVFGSDFICLSSFSKNNFSIKTNPIQKNIPTTLDFDTLPGENDDVFQNSQKINNVSGYIRKLSELNLALEISKDKSADVIVIDGSFDTKNVEEQKIFEKIEKNCLESNIIFLGISKSTGINTNLNKPIGFVLDELATMKKWFYFDESFEKKEYFIGFVKLHEKSENVFRLDFFKSQKNIVLKEINELLEISSDPVFFGYPYGLIDADEEARITDFEVEEKLADIVVKFGDFWPIVQKALKSNDSHKILDKIRF